MSIDSSILPTTSPRTAKHLLFGRYWPAGVIVTLCLAVILFFQIARIFDNGTTNIISGCSIGASLILLGLWMAVLAPFSLRVRFSAIGGALLVIAALFAAIRLDGFDGNMIPRFAWRWHVNRGISLNGESSTAQASSLDIRPTDHDFLGFLGANRDAHVPSVKLSTDWQTQPPKLLWRQPIGLGWSGFSTVGNAAITLQQHGEEELVTCYDLNSGKLEWFDAVQAHHYNKIGGDGPGSTPTLHEGRVYALGGTGLLRCLDAATGKKIWQRDVLADVGTDYETDRSGVWWGRMASPLIVDDLVIVPGGGPPGGPKVSLVAYNKTDGEIVWKGGNREISYSSPSLATYCGLRQVVIVNEDNITGHDLKTGEQLWETKWDGSSNSSATASQTVQISPNRFFVSKGYSGGGAVFELSRDDAGTWTVNKVWFNHRVLLTKQNNVVVKDGFVYGLSDGVLQCVNLENGKRQWAGEDFGHGQLLRVGDLLLVMTEAGEVALVDLNPTEFKQFGSFQAIDGKTWNNPALSGNRLLVRNGEEAACYELPLAK
jgi:outer membrane protein assembly factor BamB